MRVLWAGAPAAPAAVLALEGRSVSPRHGVGGDSPEETMRNIGKIASPGMIETERVILQIMEGKRTI